MSNFLADTWLLSTVPLTDIPFGRATFELDIRYPKALISNAAELKTIKWFHAERLLIVPGLTLTSKEHRISHFIHFFLRKGNCDSTLNITYTVVLSAPQITTHKKKSSKCVFPASFSSFQS